MPQNKEYLPIGSEHIQRYLDNRDDFTFELRVFHECIRRGFRASHGRHYTDPVKGVSRQYDVRALIESDCRSVHLAIECKNLSLNYPLVASCTPRSVDESFHEVARSTKQKAFVATQQTTIKSVRLSGLNSIYDVGAFSVKSTARVCRIATRNGKTSNEEFEGDDRDIWESWSQAISSATCIIGDAGFGVSDIHDTHYAIALPVLVVPEGSLWTVEYSPDGRRLGSPKVADECTMYIGKEVDLYMSSYTYTLSHLHILTLKGLLSLLDKLQRGCEYWSYIIPTTCVDQQFSDGRGIRALVR